MLEKEIAEIKEDVRVLRVVVNDLVAEKKGLMNAKEAAGYVGLKHGTLQKMAQREEIPHYRVNGRPKFKKAELDRWLMRRRIEARPRIMTSRKMA